MSRLAVNAEQLADDLLRQLRPAFVNALGVCLPVGVEAPAVSVPPWSDQDLEHQPKKVRLLVRYLWRRRSADLTDVCPFVWDKELKQVSIPSIKSALRKANQFLSEFVMLIAKEEAMVWLE